jgi:hypothetical protein
MFAQATFLDPRFKTFSFLATAELREAKIELAKTELLKTATMLQRSELVYMANLMKDLKSREILEKDIQHGHTKRPRLPRGKATVNLLSLTYYTNLLNTITIT